MTEDKNAENDPGDDPKIVVDDDWKTQVEKEKQELQDKMESEEEHPHELPPASFLMLVTSFATQAMVSLGQVPDPFTNQAQVNKPMAKHLIDSLAVLEEKTKGNLSQEEERYVSDTLHQLRMVYVNTPHTPPTESESSSPQIELP